MSHYGYLKTIQTYNGLGKHVDDLQRQLDMVNGDGSWMGVSNATSWRLIVLIYVYVCRPICRLGLKQRSTM